MKKIFSAILIIAGVLLLLTAASKDDMYGMAYSISEMFKTAGAGIVLLSAGVMVLMKGADDV